MRPELSQSGQEHRGAGGGGGGADMVRGGAVSFAGPNQ